MNKIMENLDLNNEATITGAAAMLAALRAAGHSATVGVADHSRLEAVWVKFADGSQLVVRDYDSGDWEYEMQLPDGDGYGGSRDITGQDIVDLVAYEASRHGDPEDDKDEWVPVNNIDPALQISCESCGHDKLDHAFFPAADGFTGAPAPLCVAAYRPLDTALIDHSCECEGFRS